MSLWVPEWDLERVIAAVDDGGQRTRYMMSTFKRFEYLS